MPRTKPARLPHEKAKWDFWLGLFLALAALGLPLIGVTVNLWLGGTLLLFAFLFLIRAFWIGPTGKSLSAGLRILVLIILAVPYFWFVESRIKKQYTADHQSGSAGDVQNATQKESEVQPSQTSPTTYVPELPEGMTLTPRQGDVQLTFRSAAIFTTVLRRRITKALTGFRDYLVALQIPVPMEVPPLGTRAAAKGGSDVPSVTAATPGDLPVYRGDITLPIELARDPRQYTYEYCNNIMEILILQGHAVQSGHSGFDVPPFTPKDKNGTSTFQLDRPTNTLHGPPSQQPIGFQAMMQMPLVSTALCTYLNRDFWNVTKPKNPDESAMLSGALWAIRQKFRPYFTNHMIGYALRDMRKYPFSGQGDYNVYFLNELKIGESVVDNGNHWPEIQAIFDKYGAFNFPGQL